MWPRSEDERLTKRLNGFVAFVKRADAARAKDEMNETELLGYVMRIGWGKTVARPTQPITLASIQARASSAASSLPVPGGAPRPTGVAPEAVSVPPNHEIIDRLALFVAQEGHPFEQEVMSREAENPSYRFLYDRGSAEHRYYRWKVAPLSSSPRRDIAALSCLAVWGGWHRGSRCPSAAARRVHYVLGGNSTRRCPALFPSGRLSLLRRQRGRMGHGVLPPAAGRAALGASAVLAPAASA
mmetsp:Transcript_5635/g.18148  ORF Transcript_5635/g.18148 Transcript_5635/m.18148 type:complete len:241 (+) Transcript_5635:905-1627(+)